jgi:predicted ATPase
MHDYRAGAAGDSALIAFRIRVFSAVLYLSFTRMLTRLQVNGFKNLVDVDVRFGPFTCIAGANGAGKSNLFDAIRFLSGLASGSLLEAAHAVRDDSGKNADVRSIFQRVGSKWKDRISFSAEMIVSPDAIDELGQPAKATTTFLRYELVIGLRDTRKVGPITLPLEIISEQLTHIQRGKAPQHILFSHNAATWREGVVLGRRSGAAFISTEVREGNNRIIKLHQDAPKEKRGGRAFERAAAPLPRTVLSSATAAESPTALCAKREMESWRLLQLEPSALREPDEFTAPSHLATNGRHLPATLYRLCQVDGDADRICAQLSNRLSELIGNVRDIRIDRDEKRELFTLQLTGADGTQLPARALSDGTLRFLALSVLELDPETPGVICLEEPENGIHPERITAILRLLQDIATDPTEPADATNPLRQVIINTHSPSVVMAVPTESLLLAHSEEALDNGVRFTKVIFSCVGGSNGRRGNWRNTNKGECREVTKGELLAYLSPASAILADDQPKRHYHRIIDDHPEFIFQEPKSH